MLATAPLSNFYSATLADFLSASEGTELSSFRVCLARPGLFSSLMGEFGKPQLARN